jgi:hypothetical protein
MQKFRPLAAALCVVSGLIVSRAAFADSEPVAKPRTTVSPSVYGGGGEMRVESDTRPDEVIGELHLGAGSNVVLRPWQTPENLDLGAFMLFGATGELRLHKPVSCLYLCDANDERWHPEAHFGLRLGIGYDFDLVGIRGGVLYADAVSAWIAEMFVSPDLQLRFGPRKLMWLELGVGAYDVATSLRPGVYAGLSFMPKSRLTVALHYGAHAGTGNLGNGERDKQIGGRADVGVMYDLSPRVRLGAGIAHQEASGFTFDDGSWEGRFDASFSF